MATLRLVAVLVFVVAAFAQAPVTNWKPLFNSRSLDGWKPTAFTNPGELKVENGELVLSPGHPLTGANATTPIPSSNYEVRFEAQRVRGNDFFAMLTFPVKDSFCSWVTGGWGGDIVGLSSIDGWDASDNETRTYFNFENSRWYAFRLRVTDDRITAWIDEQPVINVAIAGRSIALRPGPTKLMLPFGFASYNTEGRLRKIEYRVLDRK